MMKRNLGVAALLGLVAVVPAIKAYAGPACTVLGTCSPNPCPILIQNDADNCKAYETSYNRTGFNSAPGSQLTVVGKIVSFNPPLADLVPNCPTKEYTFVLSGLVSTGTVVTLNGPTTLYNTAYDAPASTPVFAIYEGMPCNTPNTFADWTANQPNGAVVPSSFQDGTVILSGVLCGFSTSISSTTLGGVTTVNGSYRVNYSATGGSRFGDVGNGVALLGGEWCVTAGCTPGPNITGYSATPKGKWDAPPTTPTSHFSWGRLKQIYR